MDHDEQTPPPTPIPPLEADRPFDVIVIGGGPAGLSGAVALARFRRSVLVIDSGAPRNAPAGHVHNFLSRDGTPPAELLAAGRAELATYGGRVSRGEVVSAHRDTDGFSVLLADGRRFTARRLLVTTGLVDQLPDLPGVAELWGTDVLHCPYCHGWEVRDRAIGILASSPLATHQAQLFRQLSDDVVVFADGQVLGDDERERLAARGIELVEDRVVGLDVAEGRLTGVRLDSGAVVRRDAIAIGPQVAARAGFLTTLGIAVVEQDMGGIRIGTTLITDPNGATTVPGVWAAGNVTDVRAQVITSAAAGLNAAAALNMDLIAEEIQVAVDARSAQPVG